jgi:uncharacterized membrane protein
MLQARRHGAEEVRSRLSNVWQKVRASFWFVPGLMALLAALLAVTTLAVDSRLGRLTVVNGWFWSGGSEGARDILTTIAGSMITVAGVTFSITIVALTLAANQFGPRLLRSFMRDAGNQVVLGTFIATFVYCLLVLRVVREAGEGVFVPHLSVTTAVTLALASLGVLIYFIHHISITLQAENLAAVIAEELGEVVEELFPERLGRPPSPGTTPGMTVPEAADDELRPVLALRSGYLQAIENEDLLDAASANGLVLCLRCTPGAFVTAGSPLVNAWPAQRCGDDLEHRIAGMFVVGRHRTPIQDVRYPIQQLVSIAVRALSPGINDPFTAIICIDWIGDGLRQLVGRRIPSRFRLDADGCLRVIAAPPGFDELADVAFNQVRQVGAGHVAVLLRLLEVIGTIGERAQREVDRGCLRRHADLVADAAARADHQGRDLAAVTALHRRVVATLCEGLDETETDETSASERA